MAHKGARDDLAAEYVRSILDYEPETGLLRWTVNRPPRGRIGRVAGVRHKSGHISIGINGAEYYAHRLIWLIMTGRWPNPEVDHRDMDASNNRWSNLREATSSQNIYNRAAANPTGLRGVSWSRISHKWMAKITINRKQIYLGIFDTADEAGAAYQRAARNLYADFAR